MRLLHVHSGNLYGGVETMLATIARYRAATPLVHEFALCFEGRIAEELRTAGAIVHQLGPARTRRPLSILRARRRLRNVLRQGQFDAAVCHMSWAHALFGAIVQASGAPQLFWMHDAATDRLQWVDRWAQRTPPDLVICNSRYTASTLPRLYRSVPHEVMFYPVETAPARRDTFQRAALRHDLATLDDAIVIVQASRIHPGKGYRVHLEALGLLRDCRDWVCWFVGGAYWRANTEFRARLEARATELGIGDRVRFCGERADVPELLRAADIFCQPNTRPEPFGIVFVEALAAGLPVVTTGLGGAAEVVDAACGLTVPPGNPAQLAASLRNLIEDGSLRQRLGAGGPARAVELCDPPTRLRDLAAIVERLAIAYGRSGARMVES